MTNIDAVAVALHDKVAALQATLLDRVTANLSGAVLAERTGRLKQSVFAALDDNGDALTATVGSDGVSYAAIQEYGGFTPAHDIVPVKAQALAFAGVGGTTFARRIDHPGSRIPARAPFGTALEACRDTIGTDLKAAVLDALGAS